MSIARAVLVGTLDQEPEQRFTPQNIAVSTLWMVVPGKPLANGQMAPATRVKLTCWRGMAEAAGQLHKDQVVMVEGKLLLPTYQDQSGVQRKHFELEVSAISAMPGGLPVAMVATATTAVGTNTPSPAPVPPPRPVQAAPDLTDDMYTVEDIPF